MNPAPTKRLKLLAGNWKMNLGPQEALRYFEELGAQLSATPLEAGVHRILFPPAYALGSDVQKSASRCDIQLGAQNVHWEDKGAFTAELSGSVLKSLGIHWVLIAHSERRQYFAETDASAQKRLEKALALGLNTIFCIGETLAERESGATNTVLARQLQAFTQVLKSKPNDDTAGAIAAIAYEPVWAIGTGKTATEAQAQEAHFFIRQELEKALGKTHAQHLSVLYGGSVTPENAKGLLKLPDVDGVLVGGASLKPESFLRILASL